MLHSGGNVVRHKQYTDGLLTALLVLLSLGPGRSPGAETPYSLQARRSLSNFLRGYEKVGQNRNALRALQTLYMQFLTLARTYLSGAILHFHAVSLPLFCWGSMLPGQQWQRTGTSTLLQP